MSNAPGPSNSGHIPEESVSGVITPVNGLSSYTKSLSDRRLELLRITTAGDNAPSHFSSTTSAGTSTPAVTFQMLCTYALQATAFRNRFRIHTSIWKNPATHR